MSHSPLEIEIALHYWTCPEPYKNGSENWTDLDCKIVQSMIVAGLIENISSGDSLSKLSGNTPAMRAYVKALEAVQWPFIMWVVPTGPHPIPSGCNPPGFYETHTIGGATSNPEGNAK